MARALLNTREQMNPVLSLFGMAFDDYSDFACDRPFPF
jgi:hypothetical protein